MFVMRSQEEMVTEQQNRQKTCQEEVTKAITLAETLQKSHDEAQAEFDKLYKQFTEEMKLLSEKK